MARATYVALLRGINVGGKNIVRMADLRAAFEDAGHEAVSTYIQSGTVLFESAGPPAALERDIETMLESTLVVGLLGSHNTVIRAEDIALPRHKHAFAHVSEPALDHSKDALP